MKEDVVFQNKQKLMVAENVKVEEYREQVIMLNKLSKSYRTFLFKVLFSLRRKKHLVRVE